METSTIACIGSRAKCRKPWGTGRNNSFGFFALWGNQVYYGKEENQGAGTGDQYDYGE